MKIVLKLLNRSVKIIELCGFNPVQDGHFRGCSLMGYPKKAPPPQNLSHISYKMKLGTGIPYLKKIQKKYESRETPFEFC